MLHFAPTIDRRHLELNTHRYAVSNPSYERDLGMENRTAPDPAPRAPRGFRPPFSRNPTRSASCLIPGSLVQTAEGLRAIEEIKIGDLVPAQDVETGTLELKPVIATTVGPPQETIAIETERDRVQATGGHLWWVSGRGWIKSRDLQPGMLVRTASATAKVQSVEVVESPRKTHNLVVDDFHTYFVGDERLLSYDVTFASPTLRLTPGFGTLVLK